MEFMLVTDAAAFLSGPYESVEATSVKGRGKGSVPLIRHTGINVEPVGWSDVSM